MQKRLSGETSVPRYQRKERLMPSIFLESAPIVLVQCLAGAPGPGRVTTLTIPDAILINRPGGGQ